LGLSSHHGIHGNNNQGVVLKNLEISDFEVAGIALNGGKDITVEEVEISKSLKKTFRAQLSQANFLDHFMNTLMPARPELAVERNNAKVTIRDKEYTVNEVFTTLHKELNTYYNSNGGKLKPVFGDGNQLPDGSAVYGLLLHTTGPAVADFGACPQTKAEEAGAMVSDVTIENVNIDDLQVDVFQQTRLILDGQQVMGPAGDVFDWGNIVDGTGAYVGTLLSDAQLAVGAFKKHLAGLNIDANELFYFFGATHMPDEVLHWASVKGRKWAGGAFKCDGDAMSHANKGAVGLFLSHVSSIGDVKDIKVSGVVNTGQVDADAKTCVQDGYKGADARGVALINSPGINVEQMRGDDVTVDSLTAGKGGKAIDFDTIKTL